MTCAMLQCRSLLFELRGEKRELTRIIHRPVNEKATDTLRICY
jgi:hypothetical protein